MADTENIIRLKQFNSTRTPEERKEQARKAGIASGKARQRKRALRDMLQDLLGSELPPEDEVRKTLEDLGIEATQEAAIGLAMIQKARKGEVEAARYLRDSAGEKISEGIKLETTNRSDPPIDLSKCTNEELYEMIRRAERANAEAEAV